ncbi:MAG: PBP1A family penicillin-binding protein [SAR324 cluster bacterium]|nr:PBP1A family penicillin-binding protein [SAR324 cluster bacterium]
MKRITWILSISLLSSPFVALAGTCTFFFIWYPQIIKDFEHSIAQLRENTVIYDHHGHPYTIIDGIEDRQIIPRQQVGRYLQLSILAIEDSRFLQHRGVDIFRVFGALWANVRQGGYLEGGSTITQQLVKIMLLSPEKTLRRKIKEVFIAWALELRFSKWEILEHYLNTIYLGYGNYGVQQAALSYFNRPASSLTLAQSAFLAGIINKPEAYLRLPKNFEKAKNVYFPNNILSQALRRQHQVLLQLYEHSWINQAEYGQATKEKLHVLIPARYPVKAPYFVQHIRMLLKNQHQLPRISNNGYKIYTTLDPALQAAAEKAIKHAFQQESLQFDQAALVAMDPRTGYIKALVGGRNYLSSQFNRVTQAMRQPGSAFKTILYATALEEGFTINSRFTDEPLSFEWQEQDGTLSLYEPRNFDRLFGVERAQVNGHGEIYYEDYYTFTKAFEQSMNTIAVQILNEIGISKLGQQAKKLNLFLRQESGLCLALGCSEVKILNLTAAYTPFMNQGYYSQPVFIESIKDSSGKEIYHYRPKKTEPVFSEWTVHQMNQLLHGVILRGTGRRANWKGNKHFIGGKTGTTTDFRDAWFIGYAPELVTGVWVGNDDNTSMKNETGGRSAAQIWSRFMKKALSVIPDRPKSPPLAYKAFPTCRVSGELATYSCPDVSNFHYPAGQLPNLPCSIHPGFLLPENESIATSPFTKTLDNSFSRKNKRGIVPPIME